MNQHAGQQVLPASDLGEIWAGSKGTQAVKHCAPVNCEIVKRQTGLASFPWRVSFTSEIAQ